MVFGLAIAATLLGFWRSSPQEFSDLYERLGLTKQATARDIKKAWFKAALKLHPDKVEGSQAEKEAAVIRFKAAAEAYEVLSDTNLKAQYDASGRVPDDKAKTEASSKSRYQKPAAGEEYGYDSDSGPSAQQQKRRTHEWRYDAFEIGLAQQRARRVRTLEQLRKLLQPEGSTPRFGLVGFYRRGQEGALKQHLRFPYPFAGWSLATQGDGFWWEDALQTVLISVGDLASNEGAALLAHFGVDTAQSNVRLPAVAWVHTDPKMSFEMALSLPTHQSFVAWVYDHIPASVRIVNNDHREATVWWLDGHQAKNQGVIAAYGGTYERSSFVSHRWYCWPSSTEGNILSPGASLGDITLSRVGDVHELILSPACIDSNGHCAQWKGLGECERNPGYMREACFKSCGSCDHWGWLYPLGLAQLHAKLACWAEPACARDRGYPDGGKPFRDAAGLRRLTGLSAQGHAWLLGGVDGRTRAALDRALAPPPVAPRSRDEL